MSVDLGGGGGNKNIRICELLIAEYGGEIGSVPRGAVISGGDLGAILRRYLVLHYPCGGGRLLALRVERAARDVSHHDPPVKRRDVAPLSVGHHALRDLLVTDLPCLRRQ